MTRSILNHKLARYITAFIIVCDLLYVIYTQLSNVNNTKLENIKVGTKNDTYHPIIIPPSQNDEDDFSEYPSYIKNFRKRPSDGYIIDYEKIVARCDMNKFLAEQCLEYLDKYESDYTIPDPNLESSKCSPDHPPMLFHVFWKGDVSDKLAMMIKSFLFTQPLQCSKLYVWLDETTIPLEENPHTIPLLSFSPKFVEFKNWNTEEQLNYDLLLRDLRPLYQTDFEFSYQWSFKQDYNTAVLRLRANSTSTRMVIEGAMKNRMRFHPFTIKRYFTDLENPTKDVLNPYIYMLPVPLFDPLWLKKDRKQPKSILTPNINAWYDVFNPDLKPKEFINVHPKDATPCLRKVDEFFSGAFAYHWHNNWLTEILPTSWMGVLQSAYDDFLKGLQPNIYNEYLL